MAARRAWVVFVDDTRNLEQDAEIGGMYKPREGSLHLTPISVFFRESSATEAAKYLANKNPGKDVHVLKQTFGFCCQAKPIEYKEWNADGTFLPVTK